MYNVSALRSAFTSLVGIQQSNLGNPNIPQIQAPLSLSTTGIWLQDKGGLLATENLWYAAPNFTPNNWRSWVSLNPYKKGNQVNYIGILYIALFDVTSAVDPLSDTVNWDVYIPFQNWLQNKYNQAVTNLFARVVTKKKIANAGKAIIERQQLYRGGGSRYNTIVNTGSWVGFEILTQQAEGLLAIIDMVGLQLSAEQLGMRFYLYHSSRAAPLAVWTLDITDAMTFVWQPLVDGEGNLNALMTYLKYNTQGVYFFGYYQDDLVGVQAISKEWDCNAPCFGCDGLNLSMYNIWSRYTTFKNVQVPVTGLEPDRTLFDTSKIYYGQKTNWGMNLSLTVRCDLTDFIIYSKNLYADAFAHQLAWEFLDAIATSSRENPFNQQIQNMARAERDPKFKGSFYYRYEESVDALNIDMSGFSTICMPCVEQGRKIKSGSI